MPRRARRSVRRAVTSIEKSFFSTFQGIVLVVDPKIMTEAAISQQPRATLASKFSVSVSKVIMFRRLADRVSSAVASVGGSGENSEEGNLERLISMGFSRGAAHEALRISGGNVEQAAEWLLQNSTSVTLSPGIAGAAALTEDDELQKAISASLEDASRSHDRSRRSAASVRAGQAALGRLDGTTPATRTIDATFPVQSHPTVKVPKKLTQHEKEDVILRCAQRVAPNATTVDVLLRSLQQLQNDTTNMKFRSVDTSTAAFQRSLNFPGVLDFFQSMGFHPRPNNKSVLELSYVDHATLYLGISALQQVQQNSIDYQHSKTQIRFDEQIQQMLTDEGSEDERAKRAAFLKKLPSEPTTAAGHISIELGSSAKVQRKFDGDDCLEDVLHFLGGQASSIPYKLERNEWFLVNRNHSEPVAYNIQELKSKTLQYMGCWPSGRLAVVPLAPAEPKADISSRGLGAAPVSLLKL